MIYAPTTRELDTAAAFMALDDETSETTSNEETR